MKVNVNSTCLMDSKIPKTLIDRIYRQRDDPVLNLSLCGLTKVPVDAIQCYYGKVEILNLSHNHLPSLSLKFCRMMNTITRLNLMRNDLKRLPDNFGTLEKLVYLNVSHNQLQTLPVSMHKMHNLAYLNLSDNPLRSPFSSILDAETRRLNRDPSPADIAQLTVRFLMMFSERMSSSGDYADNSLEMVASVENAEMGNFSVYMNDEIDDTKSDRVSVQFCNRNRNSSILKKRTASPVVDHPRRTLCQRTSSEMSVVAAYEKNTEVLSTFWRILIAFIMMTCLALAVPLLFAFFYDTAFLEEFVMKNVSFQSIWTRYQPVHEMAEYLLHWFNIRDRPFHVQGSPTEETSNTLQIIIRKIVDVFTYIPRMIISGINEMLD